MKKYFIFPALVLFFASIMFANKPCSAVGDNNSFTIHPTSNVESDFQKSFKHFLRLDQYNSEELNDELYKRLMTANLVFFSSIVLIIVLIFKQRKIRRNNKLLEESHVLINAQKIELDKMVKTRDHLFTIIAHDLRGPVGNIASMLEFICEENNQKHDRDHMMQLLELQQVAARTFQLLENLLRWASLQRESIQAKIEDNNLTTIIEEEVGLLESPAFKKEVTIKKDTQESIRASFDKDMIRIVIRNLLVNALKFSNKGGYIKIVAKVTDGQVKITIEDDGVGMTQSEIDMVLDMNQYFSKKGTKNEEGSGLGLKLCQEFIARNKGKLLVSSKIWQGSEFSFSLPLSK